MQSRKRKSHAPKVRMVCVYCGRSFTRAIRKQDHPLVTSNSETVAFGACSRCFNDGRVRSVEDLDTRCLAAAARLQADAV